MTVQVRGETHLSEDAYANLQALLKKTDNAVLVKQVGGCLGGNQVRKWREFRDQEALEKRVRIFAATFAGALNGIKETQAIETLRRHRVIAETQEFSLAPYAQVLEAFFVAEVDEDLLLGIRRKKEEIQGHPVLRRTLSYYLNDCMHETRRVLGPYALQALDEQIQVFKGNEPDVVITEPVHFELFREDSGDEVGRPQQWEPRKRVHVPQPLAPTVRRRAVPQKPLPSGKQSDPEKRPAVGEAPEKPVPPPIPRPPKIPRLPKPTEPGRKPKQRGNSGAAGLKPESHLPGSPKPGSPEPESPELVAQTAADRAAKAAPSGLPQRRGIAAHLLRGSSDPLPSYLDVVLSSESKDTIRAHETKQESETTREHETTHETETTQEPKPTQSHEDSQSLKAAGAQDNAEEKLIEESALPAVKKIDAEGSSAGKTQTARTAHTDQETIVKQSDGTLNIVLESDEIAAELQMLGALNFALIHNGARTLLSLQVENDGAQPADGLELVLTLPELLQRGDRSGERILRIPTVPAGAMLSLPEQSLTWDFPDSVFLSATEAWRTELVLTLRKSGQKLAVERVILTVHPADEFWQDGAPEALASFIRPNDETVGTLLREVSEALEETTGDGSISGYQTGGARVHKTAEAAYQVIANLDLKNAEPPVSFSTNAQRVRSPEQIVRGLLASQFDVALLYAALLEASGIAPVAVMKEDGNALIGYLTEDTQLGDAVISDASTIRSVTGSDMFEGVDTSSLVSEDQTPSFEGALSDAQTWWRFKDNQISHLVDVRAAHRWFRPLPNVTKVGDVLTIERVVSRRTRSRRALEEKKGYSLVTEDAPARVERWKRSLLDLTLRNPLLRMGKTSRLDLLLPQGGLSILQDLLRDGKIINLRAQSAVAGEGRHGLDLSDPRTDRSLVEELENANTTFADLSENQLANRVTRLRRNSREAREETGADPLYLALGVLEWKERTSSGYAPVFLLPVVLQEGLGKSGAQFIQDPSREIESNLSLFERLKRRDGLEPPLLLEPYEGEDGIDIEATLKGLRSELAIAKADGFEVHDRASIATGQFSTLLMWKDLDENWEALTESETVRRLVEDDAGRLATNEGEDAPTPLTETTAFAPLPVDSAQLEAIDLASQGHTFVLEGPPGTGKSQTIANLIAHSLAQGRKVLFVAEKQAALDVVERRLGQIGLGPFYLELHGDKQTGSKVREKLQEALSVEVQPDARQARARRNFADSVRFLNDYSDRVHAEAPTGHSLWSAHEAVLGASEDAVSPDDVVPIPYHQVLTRESVQQLRTLANELARSLGGLDGRITDSPWRFSEPRTPLTPEKRVQLAEVTEEVVAAYSAAPPKVRAVAESLFDPDVGSLVLQWLNQSRERINPAEALEQTARLKTVDSVFTNLDHEAKASHPTRFGYTADVIHEDLDAFGDLATEADGKFFGRKRRLKPIVTHLEQFSDDQLVQEDSLVFALGQLRTAKRLNEQWQKHLQRLPLPVSPSFNMFAPEDRQALRDWVTTLGNAAELGTLMKGDPALNETVEQISSFSVDDNRRLGDLLDAWWRFMSTASASPGSVSEWVGERSWVEAFESAKGPWLADARSQLVHYEAYTDAVGSLKRIEDLGLTKFAGRVRAGLVGDADVENEVELALFHAIRDERVHTQKFAHFEGRERDEMAHRFLSSGDEFRNHQQDLIAQKILQNRDKNLFDSAEGREFSSQLARRRGAMSIRRLIHTFFPLVTQATPCFLMSPSSVAKFLPPGSDNFDLVIFDEASQIRVPQAIGAMGRGKTVVVVGDSQQMPPSSMFQASTLLDEGEEFFDETLAPVDMESILSEMVESGFSRRMLSWHYRSRDESLISFSNQKYYDGSLASFPSPPVVLATPEPAIDLVQVDGVWEGGARAPRVNRKEARAIVEAVTAQVEEDPTKSIGVVTFNIQQRDLILDLLEEAAQESEALASAMREGAEPVFVKNLENVQGDERDLVYFSLAFSADETGRIPLNWGPLTRSGGEKRLNVAITRAKERVTIYSSFDPVDFNLGASRSVGLKHLKEYLLQAKTSRFVSVREQIRERDYHHREVKGALQAAGLSVRENIGLSDFTVDLAVAAPGRRWLGILLESPRWHDRTSVSDREGLPRQVLVDQMGWAAVTTLALPEWIKDPNKAVESLVEQAKSLPKVAVPVKEGNGDETSADEHEVNAERENAASPVEDSATAPDPDADPDPDAASDPAPTSVQMPMGDPEPYEKIDLKEIPPPSSRTSKFDLKVGARRTRGQINDRFGGGTQGGMVTPKGDKLMLLFSDIKKGATFGYTADGWLNEEKTRFSYTGEGQVGDQEFVRRNKQLLDSLDGGREIHLFLAVGKVWGREMKVHEYQGQFRLDPSRPYAWVETKDVDGDTRRAIKFNLIRVEAHSGK